MQTIEQSREMAKLACEALADKKGEDIRVIDIAGISVLADYFIIANGTNESQVRALLTEYGVSYIFVGSKEREKYEDSLNNALLQSLGEIVFMDEDSGTYIVKVD